MIRTFLESAEYEARIASHEERAAGFVEPHLARRRRAQKHPVWDFLFDYYRFRPTHLKKWHPGANTVLLDASTLPQASWRDYQVVDSRHVCANIASFLEHREQDVREIDELLRATASRSAHFDCFGLHEWAMLYREEHPRHDLPLRLGADGTNSVVESHQLRCSHFDAFRFFTPPARPLNVVALRREDQVSREQPGCVHATMDLFKWALKLGPLVPGELLLDCFELAKDARRLDMEASPYDCRELGFDIVPVETTEGKATYVQRQRALSARGEELRSRLVALLDVVLGR